MNEKLVKEILDFLCQKYEMHYDYREKQNHTDYRDLHCFSYFNEDGCFTITDLTQSDDLEFIHLDGLELLDGYVALSYMQKQKNIIHISKYEPEIWRKHEKILFFKNPIFWWCKKRVLKALAEVIKAQIEKTGEFFGIKV